MVVDHQQACWIIVMLLLLLLLTKESSSATASLMVKPDCPNSCGNISIPYPFGIGPNCSANETYTIACDNSSTPHRPIINSIKLELQGISLTFGTVTVHSPIIASINCPDRQTGSQIISLLGTPFSYSDFDSRFVAMGCDKLAVIKGQDMKVIAGCTSICDQTSKDKGCYGINCCQTRIPPSLKFINPSLRNIDHQNDQRECTYAFMVDQLWFNSLPDRHIVRERENVPAVLEWSMPENCSSFDGSTRHCSTNAYCYNDSRSSQNLCRCHTGYTGNAYLPDGCQDTLCANPKDNTCRRRSCTYIPGSDICNCPSGYITTGYSCYKMNNKVRTIVIGIGGLLLLLVGMWWLWKILKRRKKNKLKQKFFKRNGGLLLQQQLSSGEGNVEKTKVFTSKELEKATDNYNQNRILGQGGQGTVFKGMLTDGRIVAIKKSKIMDEGQLEQFINEVVILSQINHRNVVKIFGCCLETEVPLLVYEFIPNGTLLQYIHEENAEFPLSWNKRVQIATEVAGALSYLHSAASIPIYHRDIKSSNILLDEKYRAKVADFGTSRSLAIDQTHLTTRVMGTFGYLDPEYFQSSQFTEKSDVYSFGVVLVELLTGEKAISSIQSEEGRSLATHFISTMKANKLYDIVNASVLKEGSKHEILIIANLAKRCLNLNGRKRPTMKEVAMELEGVKVLQGASTTQKNYEEVEYEVAELNMPWDVTSTSTGSYVESGGSLSIDVQPLLLK